MNHLNILLSILVVYLLITFWYISLPQVSEVLFSRESLINSSIMGFCQSLEYSKMGKGLDDLCTFKISDSYRYKDIDVIEGRILCNISGVNKKIKIDGVFRGDDMIIDESMGWLEKRMTITHEYCHSKNWRGPVRTTLVSQGLDCDNKILIELIHDEENECYCSQIFPFNWI